jgi:hypothetical protein
MPVDIEKFIHSPMGKTLLTAGAGGLIAGGAGGIMSAKEDRPFEEKSERRKRILRNALLSGAAGAGAVGLMSGAAHQFGTALPEDTPGEKMVEEATKKGLGSLGIFGGAHTAKALADNRLGHQELHGILTSLKGRVGKSGTPDNLARNAANVLEQRNTPVRNTIMGVNKDLIKRNPELMRYLGSADENLLKQLNMTDDSLWSKVKHRLLGGRREIIPGGNVSVPGAQYTNTWLSRGPKGTNWLLKALAKKRRIPGARANALWTAGAGSAALYNLLRD